MAISRPAILVLPEDTGRSASRGVPFFFEEFLQSLVNPDGGKSRLAESLGRSC